MNHVQATTLRVVARWITIARAQLGMLRITAARHVEDIFTLIDFVRHVNI